MFEPDSPRLRLLEPSFSDVDAPLEKVLALLAELEAEVKSTTAASEQFNRLVGLGLLVRLASFLPGIRKC